MRYYSKQAIDDSLWTRAEDSFYERKYDSSYMLTREEDNDDSLYFDKIEDEKNKIILLDYQKKVEIKYVNPMLEKLYPFKKWRGKKDIFNYEKIMKKFYLEASKNSFKEAIKQFNLKVDNFLNLYLSKNLHNDFHRFSKAIISTIENWHNVLFIGDGNIFRNSSYSKGAEKSWIPLLQKLGINITNTSVSTSLVVALKEYMYIYSLYKTLIANNQSNMIIGEDFKSISSISPILDYIYKTMNLNKPEFNYIFFSLLRQNHCIKDSEIKFLIHNIEGVTKKTFVKNEQLLPLIKNTICPMFRTLQV